MPIRTIREEPRRSSGRAQCSYCGTPFPVGTLYTRITHEKSGDRIYSCTSCKSCDEFYSRLFRDSAYENSEDVMTGDVIAWADEWGIYSNSKDVRAAAVGFLARLGLSVGEEDDDAEANPT